MSITFGIITQPATGQYLKKIIDSIHIQEIPQYQIILSGEIDRINLQLDYVIPNNRFSIEYCQDLESVKCAKITTLKNTVTKYAKYNTIVYLHDYIYLDDNWYSELEKFGYDWDVLCTPVINPDGSNFRSLCYWDKPGLGNSWTCYEKWCGPNGIRFEGSPHFVSNFENFDYSRCYINGSYWIAKRKVMEQHPLNEDLKWGQGEDAEFSIRIRNKCKIAYNPNSIVKLLKHKTIGIPQV